MTVKLIGYTMPVPEIENEGIEDVQDLIAFCARVSNPSNQYNTETSDKLLNYLAKHAHWSPFEMVSATLEITTTRDIARQILRHRSFSFQEFSQRYADPTKDMEFILRPARFQDTKNRQNSIEFDLTDPDNYAIHVEWLARQQELIEMAKRHYKWAIDAGLAKEVSRSVLPEGNTESRIYMAGTIRSWIHYVQLRSGNGTQLEHQRIAKQCGSEVAKIVPIIANFVGPASS